jgi:chondroitin AC lyase
MIHLLHFRTWIKQQKGPVYALYHLSCYFWAANMNIQVKFTKKIIIFISLIVSTLSAYSQTPDAYIAIKNIRAKCRALLLSDNVYSTERSFHLTEDIKYTTDAAGYLKTLTPDGSWPDIQYQSQTRGSWMPSWHLYRILLLSRAYNKGKDPAYLVAIHKALRFWIRNDFKCENWWHNNINVPFGYATAILQLGDKAEPDELAFLDNVLVKRIPVAGATGQNLVWQLDNEARVALIHNDYQAFTRIIANMQKVIEVTTKEGIQPDYSFHQHGPMMQIGNYGMSFVNTLLFWMAVTTDSPVAFAKQKQQIIFNYCTEGIRWTIYKGAMDLPAIGRQLRYNATLKRGDNLRDAFDLISTFDKTLGCKGVIDGIATPGTASCTLAGNKSFWRSDYMVQLKKENYMMSVKMHGPFVSRLESINAENLSGAYFNDGIALVQHSGNEYKNIEAIWNWAMLPGTTCDTAIGSSSKAAFATRLTTKFMGQVSNGAAGISAMDYNRADIRAHKSYFFVDDMLIALGAGVTSADSKNLVTTVNQSFTNGPLVVGKTADNRRWLWHDDMAYYFPYENQTVKNQTQYRHGGWEHVNTNNTAGDKPSAGNVLTTYITHDQDDKYAYIIKPGISLKQAKVSKNTGVTILANTTDLQAIASKNTVMIVFYKAGSITVGQTVLITDKPCMLILKKDGDKLNDIWISDPTRKEATVTLGINKTTCEVKLPAGDYLGSSVKAAL